VSTATGTIFTAQSKVAYNNNTAAQWNVCACRCRQNAMIIIIITTTRNTVVPALRLYVVRELPWNSFGRNTGVRTSIRVSSFPRELSFPCTRVRTTTRRYQFVVRERKRYRTRPLPVRGFRFFVLRGRNKNTRHNNNPEIR